MFWIETLKEVIFEKIAFNCNDLTANLNDDNDSN
jgi:hypothetical protein